MPVRKSNMFFGFLSFSIIVVVFLLLHALYSDRKHTHYVQEHTRIVKQYGLTDLCLFTDARYTRNPTMADIATPFQDHPVSLEHFPSGSIISPPARVIHGLD